MQRAAPKPLRLRTASVAALLLDALAVAGCTGGAHTPAPPAPLPEPPPPVAPHTPHVDPVTTASVAVPTAPAPEPPPPVTPDPPDLACSDGQRNVLLDLRPQEPATRVELRQRHHHSVQRLLTAGASCTGAPEPARCQAELRDATSTTGFGPRCGPMSCASFLVVQDGDKTRIVSSMEALSAFLGPIDTADEAALVAYAHGYGLPACDGAQPKEMSGAWVSSHDRMISDCPVTHADQTIAIGADASLRILSQSNVRKTGMCVGRRPAGLAAMAAIDTPCASGAYLAECAELEAASVTAFERLADELAALGAPHRLRRACRAAAADEVRHARVTARLARRRGATPRRPEVAPAPRRDAIALALDNAVEGCVRETFGALVGLHQAAAAADPEVRRAMQAIAADEVRHATLAWRIARWLEPRLTPSARRRVERARAKAVSALRSELAAPPPAALEHELGLPGAAAALAMAARLETTLWADERALA